MIRVTLPTVALAAVFLLSGFGSCEVSCGKRKLDPEKAEGAVRDFFTTAQAVVTKVSCPERIDVKKGKSFTCTATVENGDLIEVEITHRDGGFEITRFDNVVAMTKVEATIAEMVEKNPATKAKNIGAASCPADKRAKKGDVSRCSAIAEDKTGFLFNVIEKDSEGNISVQFAGVSVPPDVLAAQLTAMLGRKKVKATVACGDKPVELVEKVMVACQATDEKGKLASLEILPKTPYGDFDWRIVVK